jgi:hypothetical protein
VPPKNNRERMTVTKQHYFYDRLNTVNDCYNSVWGTFPHLILSHLFRTEIFVWNSSSFNLMIHHKQKTNPRFNSAFNVVTLCPTQLSVHIFLYVLLSQKNSEPYIKLCSHLRSIKYHFTGTFCGKKLKGTKLGDL